MEVNTRTYYIEFSFLDLYSEQNRNYLNSKWSVVLILDENSVVLNKFLAACINDPYLLNVPIFI